MTKIIIEIDNPQKAANLKDMLVRNTIMGGIFYFHFLFITLSYV